GPALTRVEQSHCGCDMKSLMGGCQVKLCKRVWMLVVPCLLMAGCSTDDGPCTEDADCGSAQRCAKPTGQCVAKVDRNLLCSSSADCFPLEICHPTAKVCVTPCRASADCPDATKVCDGVSDTDGTKVCQCSTDASCNQDRLHADLICSNLDRVCAHKCV